MTREKDAKQGGLIYSRFNHPNLQIAEERLALYEQGDAAAVFSSGMSAIAIAHVLILLRNALLVKAAVA